MDCPHTGRRLTVCDDCGYVIDFDPVVENLGDNFVENRLERVTSRHGLAAAALDSWSHAGLASGGPAPKPGAAGRPEQASGE